MRWLLICLLVLSSKQVLGSASVICKSTTGKQASLSWGATRGIGSPRFGPYRLSWEGKDYMLYPHKVSKDQYKAPKGTIVLDVSEVGYWVDDQVVRVRLADAQLTWTMLHIEVRRQPQAAYDGEAIVWLEKDSHTRKVGLQCDS